jgi:opacity protein-like surface antigen
MLRKAALIVAALFLVTSLGLGQDQGHFDASFNGAGVFTKQSNGNNIQQSATDGSNYFGTFRLRFSPKHSMVFNYGRAKNSQIYQTGGFDFHVQTTISEYTGAYVYTPIKKGKFEPFVLVGGGLLSFSPKSTWLILPDFFVDVPNRVQVNLNTAKQRQLAFLYGGGVDYRLPWKLALRLQYRGFLYDAPDFKVNGTTGSTVSFFTGSKGHMAEPSVGLVFKF